MMDPLKSLHAWRLDLTPLRGLRPTSSLLRTALPIPLVPGLGAVESLISDHLPIGPVMLCVEHHALHVVVDTDALESCVAEPLSDRVKCGRSPATWDAHFRPCKQIELHPSTASKKQCTDIRELLDAWDRNAEAWRRAA